MSTPDFEITPLGEMALAGADMTQDVLAATLFATYHNAEFGGAEMVLRTDEAERKRWRRVALAANIFIAAAGVNKGARA